MAIALVAVGVLLMLTRTSSEEIIPADDWQAKDGTSETFYNGDKAKETSEVKWPKAMEVPAKMSGTQEMLLKRDGFWAFYNKDRKIPNWVAWHLTSAHTRGGNQRDDMEFTEDNEGPTHVLPMTTITVRTTTVVICVRPVTTNGTEEHSCKPSNFLISVRKTIRLIRATGTTSRFSVATGQGRWATSISSQVPSSTMV